jgi:hypothetical protein
MRDSEDRGSKRGCTDPVYCGGRANVIYHVVALGSFYVHPGDMTPTHDDEDPGPAKPTSGTEGLPNLIPAVISWTKQLVDASSSKPEPSPNVFVSMSYDEHLSGEIDDIRIHITNQSDQLVDLTSLGIECTSNNFCAQGIKLESRWESILQVRPNTSGSLLLCSNCISGHPYLVANTLPLHGGLPYQISANLSYWDTSWKKFMSQNLSAKFKRQRDRTDR